MHTGCTPSLQRCPRVARQHSTSHLQTVASLHCEPSCPHHGGPTLCNYDHATVRYDAHGPVPAAAVCCYPGLRVWGRRDPCVLSYEQNRYAIRDMRTRSELIAKYWLGGFGCAWIAYRHGTIEQVIETLAKVSSHGGGDAGAVLKGIACVWQANLAAMVLFHRLADVVQPILYHRPEPPLPLRSAEGRSSRRMSVSSATHSKAQPPVEGPTSQVSTSSASTLATGSATTRRRSTSRV